MLEHRKQYHQSQGTFQDLEAPSVRSSFLVTIFETLSHLPSINESERAPIVLNCITAFEKCVDVIQVLMNKNSSEVLASNWKQVKEEYQRSDDNEIKSSILECSKVVYVGFENPENESEIRNQQFESRRKKREERREVVKERYSNAMLDVLVALDDVIGDSYVVDFESMMKKVATRLEEIAMKFSSILSKVVNSLKSKDPVLNRVIPKLKKLGKKIYGMVEKGLKMFDNVKAKNGPSKSKNERNGRDPKKQTDEKVGGNEKNGEDEKGSENKKDSGNEREGRCEKAGEERECGMQGS